MTVADRTQKPPILIVSEIRFWDRIKSKNTKAALQAWKDRPESEGKRLGAPDEALVRARAAAKIVRKESAEA